MNVEETSNVSPQFLVFDHFFFYNVERTVLLVGKSVYIHENLHIAQRPKNADSDLSLL